MYLEEKTGKVKDMWLTPNEFIDFGGLYKIADNMRHVECTDDAGWTQFCLFAAAKAFREKTKKETTRKIIVAKSMENIIVPYLKFINPSSRLYTRREYSQFNHTSVGQT